jgi:hypothetical protein
MKMVMILLCVIVLQCCITTDLINAPIESIDTLFTKADTTEYARDSLVIDIEIDSTMNEVQHPIVFNPSVVDWEEEQNL